MWCNVADRLDDLIRAVFQEIFDNGVPVRATRGSNSEIRGITLTLTRPRARVSSTETRGKPFSCLGELCWYLAGSDDAEFISYYIGDHYKIVDDGRIRAAYGPRLFGEGELAQVKNTTLLLTKKPSSRQAVIQLFDVSDLGSKSEPPCTCTLQFFIRSDKLEVIAHMRSNDSYIGLPHDVFCFTMLQELMACELELELGPYTHMVGSMHLYDEDRESAKLFLDEGWQSCAEMMAMPSGSPWNEISDLLKYEEQLRMDKSKTVYEANSDQTYWGDLRRLLLAFRCKRTDQFDAVTAIRERMVSPIFSPFLEKIEQM